MEEKKGLELDLRHIAKLLFAKLWLIVLVAMLCAAIMVGYVVFFVPDTYTVVTQMTVSNVVDAPNVEQVGMTSSDVTAATSLLDTYCVILKNEHSLNRILDEAGLENKYSIGQLRSMISAGGVNESLVLQIQVTGTNAQDTQAIANAATKVLQETALRGASASPLYQVAAPDVDRPDSKGTSTKAVVGGMLGAVVTALLLIVVDLKRDNVHSDAWLKETFGEAIPVLSVIPDASQGTANGKHYGYRYSRYSYYRSNPTKKA